MQNGLTPDPVPPKEFKSPLFDLFDNEVVGKDYILIFECAKISSCYGKTCPRMCRRLQLP
jgi:hypothetical protein